LEIFILYSAVKEFFENRLRFEKVIAKSLVASFFGTQCSHVTGRLIICMCLRLCKFCYCQLPGFGVAMVKFRALICCRASRNYTR